jgi:putative aldouronate transport system substrate-binding protein
MAVLAAVLGLVAAGSVAAGGQRGSASGGGGRGGTLDTSKEVELVLYVIGVEPVKQAELSANFNRIAKEKLNCTLKINWIGWSEFPTKYPLHFSSGEVFDLAYCATWLNFAALAQRGAFMPLDELWPQYAPKNHARQSKTALRQATVNGRLYGIPTLLATYSAFGAIYRADMALPYGWDGKMETFDDMEKFFQIVKDHNPGIEPLDIHSGDGSMLDRLLTGYERIFGLNSYLFLDASERNPKLFTHGEWDRIPSFLAMINRWNEKGFWPKSALANQDSEKFRNGKTALRIHNVDSWEGIYRDRPEWNIGWSNFERDVSNLAFTQDALVIPITSRNPERALALYDLITSDQEAFRAFFYGIEGKSYEIQRVDGQEYIRALNPDEYAFSNLWAARTKEFFLPALGAPPNLRAIKSGWDAQIKDGVGAQRIRSLVLDYTAVETEHASCENVLRQYWWPLELGYVDPVKGLQEFREKMQAAGIEKVRAELQRQLDAYLATL